MTKLFCDICEKQIDGTSMLADGDVIVRVGNAMIGVTILSRLSSSAVHVHKDCAHKAMMDELVKKTTATT